MKILFIAKKKAVYCMGNFSYRNVENKNNLLDSSFGHDRMYGIEVGDCCSVAAINEPRRKKTGLRGFRPGPTQTGLYKLRKELEA